MYPSDTMRDAQVEHMSSMREQLSARMRCVLAMVRSVVVTGFDIVQRVIYEGPLRTLYRNGPSVGAYGFWAGMPSVDVCASLTQTPARVWELNPAACDDIVERQFMAFYTGVSSVAYVFIAYRVCALIWDAICMQRRGHHVPPTPHVSVMAIGDLVQLARMMRNSEDSKMIEDNKQVQCDNKA
jgi:hypothetical protein